MFVVTQGSLAPHPAEVHDVKRHNLDHHRRRPQRREREARPPGERGQCDLLEVAQLGAVEGALGGADHFEIRIGHGGLLARSIAAEVMDPVSTRSVFHDTSRQLLHGGA